MPGLVPGIHASPHAASLRLMFDVTVRGLAVMPGTRPRLSHPVVVMAVPGLDPRICPGHPRGAASYNVRLWGSRLGVDTRHKAGHDDLGLHVGA